jgi:hypothetical protein
MSMFTKLPHRENTDRIKYIMAIYRKDRSAVWIEIKDVNGGMLGAMGDGLDWE